MERFHFHRPHEMFFFVFDIDDRSLIIKWSEHRSKKIRKLERQSEAESETVKNSIRTCQYRHQLVDQLGFLSLKRWNI